MKDNAFYDNSGGGATLSETLPTDEEVKKAVEILKSFSLNAVDGKTA